MRREHELCAEAFASDGGRCDLVQQVGARRSYRLNGGLTCRKGVANPCVDDLRTLFNLSIHADQRTGQWFTDASAPRVFHRMRAVR